MAQEEIIDVTLALVGNQGVGKSSVVERYMNDTFEDSTFSAVTDKVIDVFVGGKHVKLRFMDSTGGHGIKTVAASFARLAQGLIIVYDVSNEDSFKAVTNWVVEIQEHVGKERAKQCLLIGNKSDVAEGDRKVRKAEVELWLETNNYFRHIEASAKTGDNINEAIEMLVKRELQKMGYKLDETSGGDAGDGNNLAGGDGNNLAGDCVGGVGSGTGCCCGCEVS